jgi:hypothetical protein
MKSRVNISRLLWTGLFALAFAYVEAAVVVYLRRIGGITDPLQGAPLDTYIGTIEVGREAATLVMLLAAGWIAGSKFQSRIGYAAIAFGVWDIFYYIWLRVLTGWPQSLLDPDILFLIPLPWWGPVIAPVLISLLLIAAGVLGVVKAEQGQALRPGWAGWSAVAAGVLVMLFAFMADALRLLPASAAELNAMLPGQFLWPVFLVGFIMAAAGVARMGWTVRPHEQVEGFNPVPSE